MKQLLFALTFLLPLAGYSQGDQTLIKVPINANSTETGILHLPDDYATATTTYYPIMVFLHGQGEGGANPASIYNSSTAGGPAYFIGQKTFPASFVNPVDKKSYKYIIVSPQSTNGWSTTASQLDTILSFLVRVYRVDPARIYLTGLSAGGEGVLEYAAELTSTNVKVVQNNKIAAFIPMSAVMNAANSVTMAKTVVSNGVDVWGFGSPTDTHGANTLSFIWNVNNIKANYGLSTSYSGGHCCWGQFYNPSFTQNGLNIYQWALQFTSSGSAPVVTTPPLTTGCPTCPTVDSTGIIKAYLAAHPCPICPVCPKQRSMIGIHTDIVGGVCVETILYDDGSIQAISK